MKHAISIIAIVCLSACATPTPQPPSQPAPTADTAPAETEPTEAEKLDSLFANQTQEDWDAMSRGINAASTQYLVKMFMDLTSPANLEYMTQRMKETDKVPIGNAGQLMLIELRHVSAIIIHLAKLELRFGVAG